MAELNKLLFEGFTTLPTQTWIPVIPQILARLKTRNVHLMAMLRLLLGRVSDVYPEALVFPMIAAVDVERRMDSEAKESRCLALLQSIALRHPVRF